ncbi:MAG: hypothetical protein AVDCRST_MAG89-731, partial [uncultured Gemmatimonadetes bacterium]
DARRARSGHPLRRARPRSRPPGGASQPRGAGAQGAPRHRAELGHRPGSRSDAPRAARRGRDRRPGDRVPPHAAHPAPVRLPGRGRRPAHRRRHRPGRGDRRGRGARQRLRRRGDGQLPRARLQDLLRHPARPGERRLGRARSAAGRVAES